MNKNDLLKNSIAILQELIAFDTTSRESNLAIIEHIQSYLDNLGIDSRLTHDETGSKANLWATIGPDIAGGVVLSGHLYRSTVSSGPVTLLTCGKQKASCMVVVLLT